jgi:Protein of unknown function (DUF664)
MVVSEPMSPADVVREYRVEVARSDAYLAGAQPDDAPRWWPDGDREDRPADLVEVTSHLLAGPPHPPVTTRSFGG